MTAFESRGVELQMECESKSQAEKRFEHSCNLCCKRGLRIECDRCAISVVHDKIQKMMGSSSTLVFAH